MTDLSLGPNDVVVRCAWCHALYEYDQNLLNGQWMWVRRCKAACKRKHSVQKVEGRRIGEETWDG